MYRLVRFLEFAARFVCGPLDVKPGIEISSFCYKTWVVFSEMRLKSRIVNAAAFVFNLQLIELRISL